MDSTKEEAELLFDPKTMRKTRPGLKRLILITSVLFSFISGLPFLLKSIEIYRSPLPFREIHDLSERIELDSLYIPCRFQVVALGFDGNESVVEKLGFEVLEKMRELNGNDLVCGGCGSNYTVSVTVENEGGNCVSYGDTGFWRCGAVDAFEFGKSDDDELDELLVKGLGGKVYSVVVVNRDEEVRVVVGKYRHAWVTGRVGEMNVVDNVASVFVKFFMKGGKEEGMAQGEFMPVGADGKVVLSFSLLNADPQDWIY
ncbi:hypothetical protein IFM89_009137 [Coptis chinensis]|uniref:Uncharacterized protein n=1 Tax=Coptis chinensis TaxID=261450 RepID=A0A835HTW7_9MAGN|nr:hypothetical protein IFM89_009137 [Coptis chinensis]